MEAKVPGDTMEELFLSCPIGHGRQAEKLHKRPGISKLPIGHGSLYKRYEGVVCLSKLPIGHGRTVEHINGRS